MLILQGNHENRETLMDNKIIDYINYILRNKDMLDACDAEDVTGVIIKWLDQSTAGVRAAVEHRRPADRPAGGERPGQSQGCHGYRRHPGPKSAAQRHHRVLFGAKSDGSYIFHSSLILLVPSTDNHK